MGAKKQTSKPTADSDAKTTTKPAKEPAPGSARKPAAKPAKKPAAKKAAKKAKPKKVKEVVELEIAGQNITVTSPNKIFFELHGETKLDLVNYYLAVAEPLLNTMGGRPTLMQRFPNGVGGKSFFQKRVPSSAPEWLETTTVSTPNGTESNAMVAKDLAHITWAVNLGCLGFHPWPYQAANPEHTDELRIDLDPSPGVDFAAIQQAAFLIKTFLDQLSLVSFIKTSGNRGLHIYLRLEPGHDGYAVRSAAVALARELERQNPQHLTAAWWKEERGRRVFIDFNQNAPHKTVFGAWSVRARKGAQISTPISWEEVETINPDELNMRTVPQRLSDNGDPWATINDSPNPLEPLLALHERDMENGMMDAPWPPQYPKQPNEPSRVAPSRAKKPD